MLFRVSREQAYQDSEALALWIYAVNETAQAFSRLSDAFRTATQRTRNSQVLKRDVHGALAIQAGRLLSESWDRGAFPEHFYWTYGRRSCLWELFRLRHPDANDLTHVWLWFAFIRWNLIPRYERDRKSVV